MIKLMIKLMIIREMKADNPSGNFGYIAGILNQKKPETVLIR